MMEFLLIVCFDQSIDRIRTGLECDSERIMYSVEERPIEAFE